MSAWNGIYTGKDPLDMASRDEDDGAQAMTTTPPAVDLDELERLLEEVEQADATYGARVSDTSDAAEELTDLHDAEARLHAALCQNPSALISELTELRASRSMMEEVVAALTPFATDEFMDHGEDRTVIATWHGDGYSFRSSPERILRATDFARAQSALTAIKEKTT